MPKTGVLLLNLGGPETYQDIRRFLFNLFSDPGIIRIKSHFMRRTLAWFIAAVRQNRSRRMYKEIGGGSPLRRITEMQAAALESALRDKGFDTRVYVGMLLWKPGIEEAVEQILREQVNRLVVLPLFPQYSITTTGSCFNRFRALDLQFGLSCKIDIRTVKEWYDDPLYIEAMSDLIRESAGLFSLSENEKLNLLYSAHSIPMRYLEEGDPYLEQIQRTVTLIEAKLDTSFQSHLAFQSKIGPVRWLRPSTREILQEMGRRGCSKVLLVPIGFVSDHLETLYEMDIEYREIAIRSGVREFYRAPSLNLYPKFIEALASRVMCEIC